MTLSVKQNVENGEKNGGLKRNVSRCNLIGINFPSISLFDYLAVTWARRRDRRGVVRLSDVCGRHAGQSGLLLYRLQI